MSKYTSEECIDIFVNALGTLIGYVGFLINGAILKYIWNTLLVNLFHLSVINYIQSILLIIAAEILFKVRSVNAIQTK